MPVKSFFDHLEAGYNVDYFLMQFPTVEREQLIAVLKAAEARAETDATLVERASEAASGRESAVRASSVVDADA